MPRKKLLAAFLTTALAAPASAGAAVPHTVGAGETLWSIAAANNFTTRSLAAYNGLSPDSNVVLGTTIQIPAVPEAASALARSGAVSSTGAPTATAAAPPPPPAPTTATAGSGPPPPPRRGAPPPQGGYVVRPGDTLSGLAAQAGVPVAQMAAMNGLSPTAMV